MDKITVNKDALAVVLGANREKHRETFLAAQDGFRRRVIEELERRLKDARNGVKFDCWISLQAPIDQTKEYDQAIKMLEMAVGETMEISREDFTCFVMDEWGWSKHVSAVNSVYLTQ